jgi:hypothetical protein
MDHGTLLEQLKQGEPVAIATLLNRYLEPKGIKAQASSSRQSFAFSFGISPIRSKSGCLYGLYSTWGGGN